MWRDYVGYAVVAVAIVNGLLAFLIAQMPGRLSVFKLRVAVAALVLAVLAGGVMIYSRYQANAQVQRAETARGEVRNRLRMLITEGQALLAQIADSQKELPNRPADEWAQRAELYLGEKLGEPYVARFRQDVTSVYGDAPVATQRLGYWRAVRNRVVNLEAINAELSDPPAVR